MAQERIFRVRLLIPRLDVIRDLAVDNECMPIHRRGDGQIEMEAIVPETTLTKLRGMKKRSVYVEVIGDSRQADDAGEGSKMVSRVNRYADGSLPRGLGNKRG